jgi:hypothetical protein
MAGDVESKLRDDCLPDIVGAQHEVQILLESVDDTMYKSIRGGCYSWSCGAGVQVFEGVVGEEKLGFVAVGDFDGTRFG